jgi:hypothetical protein
MSAAAAYVVAAELDRPERGEINSDIVTIDPPVDLLAQAIERTRALLADRTRPTKERVRILWSAAKRARDLGASDVVRDAFAALAVDVALIGREDISHAIDWALRGWNPFEKGPLT